MKKIVLIKGLSKYNVVRYWIDGLAKGFEKLGIETIILDTKYSINNQSLTLLQMDVDAVIAFNGTLIEQKEVLEKVVKAPFIYLLIDHPIDHIARIENLRDQDILTLMDRNDITNLAHFGLQPSNVFMLPHAALEMSLEPIEKTIDILVSGTFSDLSKYTAYIESQSPAIFKICQEVIQVCLEDSNKYYIDEFLKAFEQRDVKLELRLHKNPQFIKMVHEIGRYIYSIYRLRVITALAEAGFSVDIYGEGWNNSPLVQYPNVTIHEQMNYWEMQNLMCQSKVVMNFQALLRDGTHERVFAGMAARSVVVTNETPYLKELFKEDEELLFYHFNDLDRMVKKIEMILNDTQHREDMSKAAWHAIKDKHTFDHRAQQIVDIYQEVKKNDGKIIREGNL